MSSAVYWIVLILFYTFALKTNLSGTNLFLCLMSSTQYNAQENNKGVVKSYEMNADNQLIDVTISGYRVLHKKILKEKNGWRTMVLLEYKLT